MAKPNSVPLRKGQEQGPDYRWYGHYCSIEDAGFDIQEETPDPLFLSFFIVHEPGGGPIAGITVTSQKHGEKSLVDLLHHPGLSDELPMPETICVSTEEARAALKKELAGKPIAVELIPEPAYVDDILEQMREEMEGGSDQSILTSGELSESVREKLIESSMEFLESYVWESVYDSEIFALEADGKGMAYCLVIGGGGEQVGVSVFEDPAVLLKVLRDEVTLGYTPPSSMALLFDGVAEDDETEAESAPPPPEIYSFDAKGRMVEPDEAGIVQLVAILTALNKLTDVEEWPIEPGSALEWEAKSGKKLVQWKFSYLGDYEEEEEAVIAAMERLSGE